MTRTNSTAIANDNLAIFESHLKIAFHFYSTILRSLAVAKCAKKLLNLCKNLEFKINWLKDKPQNYPHEAGEEGYCFIFVFHCKQCSFASVMAQYVKGSNLGRSYTRK